MNSDSIFMIGKSHKVCQDYSTHDLINDLQFVLLSDGCSSSPNTDYGSRLLTLRAKSIIKKYNGNNIPYIMYDKLEDDLKTFQPITELPIETFDATLLSIVAHENGYFKTSCFGDGVIAFLRYDGTIDVAIIEYPSGAPFYLSYNLQSDRKILYGEKFGFNRIIKTYKIDDVGCTLKETIIRKDCDPWFWSGDVSSTKAVVVFSDGVLSFTEPSKSDTSKAREAIPFEKIIRELMAFKNFHGTFVHRRVQAFMKKCEAENIWAYDDFSMGAIYLGE